MTHLDLTLREFQVSNKFRYSSSKAIVVKCCN